MKTNKYLVGLVFGIVGAVWHLFWSVLVWLGWAQGFIDFIFRLHFITPPYKITPFDLRTAAMLVTIVFIGPSSDLLLRSCGICFTNNRR